MKNVFAALFALLAFAVLSPTSAMADTWGDQIDPAFRFTVLPGYGGTAVLDNETGLVWEQSPSTTVFTWDQANIARCDPLTAGNRLGWRFPTLQELGSLVDLTQSNPTLPVGHPFSGNVQPSQYWTATSNANGAWFVHFGNGGVGVNAKTTRNWVWCVRGGQGLATQ